AGPTGGQSASTAGAAAVVGALLRFAARPVVGWLHSVSTGLAGAVDRSGWSSAATIAIGRSASESRRQVTCSPSSQRIFTDTALAHTMRPVTPSSVQRTRLPIFSVATSPAGAAGVSGVFFLRGMIYLPG